MAHLGMQTMIKILDENVEVQQRVLALIGQIGSPIVVLRGNKPNQTSAVDHLASDVVTPEDDPLVSMLSEQANSMLTGIAELLPLDLPLVPGEFAIPFPPTSVFTGWMVFAIQTPVGSPHANKSGSLFAVLLSKIK